MYNKHNFFNYWISTICWRHSRSVSTTIPHLHFDKTWILAKASLRLVAVSSIHIVRQCAVTQIHCHVLKPTDDNPTFRFNKLKFSCKRLDVKCVVTFENSNISYADITGWWQSITGTLYIGLLTSSVAPFSAVGPIEVNLDWFKFNSKSRLFIVCLTCFSQLNKLHISFVCSRRKSHVNGYCRPHK